MSTRRISRHFCGVGTPPDDPDFCLDSLNESERWIETNLQSGTDATQMADLSGDPQFSASEVSEEFAKLNNSALGLDGLSKNIIFPILSIISPAVASLFSALLRFSVSPSDWKIAVLALIRKKGTSRVDLNHFRAVHLLSFFYKWFTRCLRRRILPFVADKIPEQQRGFIDGGSCAQALLALLTVVQRETQENGHLYACFVDIRKAFPRVRREILYFKMARLGIPTIYIKCLSALYTDIQGSVRSSAGFCAPFRISQGTREGCILSPLLFVIYIL